MFTELLNQTNKFISCYITEEEYITYINDLIKSNIIDQDYITNLIKSNIFYQHKYNNILNMLLNIFNKNNLLKNDHYSLLIRNNNDINVSYFDNYDIIDYIDDLYDYITNNDINNKVKCHLINIIKNISNNHESLLLLLNDYPECFNKYKEVKDYIYDKQIHISYKEWPNKYPNLWSNIKNYYTLDPNFLNIRNIDVYEISKHNVNFDIDLSNLYEEI